MLICFYGDHTHAHTILSRASWRSSRGERDRARSNWIGLRETRLIFIFLIVCLCYSGILNPRFSAFWGLSFSFLFFLLDFLLVVWFRELDQDLDWTWQAREREKSRNWRQTRYVTLCPHTRNYWSKFCNDEGFHFNPVFLFSPPAQSNWMPKTDTCVIGVTGENWTVASICTRFIS